MISTLLQDNAFVTTWNTENVGSATKTIVIPTSSIGTYSCTVDWGDGKTNYMTTYNDAAWTHLYASTGTYTIKIYGKFVGIVFNNTGDKLKLLTVQKWGPGFRIGTNQGAYFSGCTNLTIKATDVLNLSGTTSLYQAFLSCTSITTIPNINQWDTSEITNMSQTFKGCTSFNQNLNTFQTVNVTTMSDMFYGCTSFNGSVAGFNTANVTLMLGVFFNCSAFNQSVSNFNTAAVTQMNSMFGGCSSFNQSVSNFNTALVTNMINMFNGATVFNQSVANFNTANVTNMASMFQNCSAFDQAVNGFNTAKVTTMNSMFSGCTVFNSVVSNFDTALVTNMSSMFQYCTLFNKDVSAFNIAKLANASNMFASSGFSLNQYDKLLNSTTGWPSQATILSNVSFHAGTAHYSTGSPITGRTFLTVIKLWTITDGGTP